MTPMTIGHSSLKKDARCEMSLRHPCEGEGGVEGRSGDGCSGEGSGECTTSWPAERSSGFLQRQAPQNTLALRSRRIRRNPASRRDNMHHRRTNRISQSRSPKHHTSDYYYPQSTLDRGWLLGVVAAAVAIAAVLAVMAVMAGVSLQVRIHASHCHR